MSHSFIGYGEVKLKRGSVTVEFKRTCCREKLIRRKGHHTFRPDSFKKDFAHQMHTSRQEDHLGTLS